MSRVSALALTVTLGACASSSGANTPQDWQTATRACARLTACFEFQGFGGGFQACMSGLPAQRVASGGLGGLAGLAPADSDNPVFACAATAETCEAAGRCINLGEPAVACDESHCEGTILRSCHSGVSVAYDCASNGEECLGERGGIIQCGRPASCPERTSECRDGQAVQCAGDVETAIPCELDCIEVGGSAVCADTSGPACEPGVASSRCDGDVAVRCRFGFETRLACAAGTCEVTSDGALCRSARECTTSACEGATLLACPPDGRITPVDCQDVGARSCEVDAMGARCVL